MILRKQNAVADEPVDVKIAGARIPVSFKTFEITDEPMHTFAEKTVRALHEEAHRALIDGQGEKAERLLREALRKEPDDPALLNNLAASLEMTGKSGEARTIIYDLHMRHPGYLIASVGIAGLELRKGNRSRARQILEPFLSRKRFHISEISALLRMETDIALSMKDIAAAKSWYSAWKEIEPENPDQEDYAFLEPETDEKSAFTGSVSEKTGRRANNRKR